MRKTKNGWKGPAISMFIGAAICSFVLLLIRASYSRPWAGGGGPFTNSMGFAEIFLLPILAILFFLFLSWTKKGNKLVHVLAFLVGYNLVWVILTWVLFSPLFDPSVSLGEYLILQIKGPWAVLVLAFFSIGINLILIVGATFFLTYHLTKSLKSESRILVALSLFFLFSIPSAAAQWVRIIWWT